MLRHLRKANLEQQQATGKHLIEHIVSFGRVLRSAGLTVGTGQIMDAVKALTVIGVQKRRDVYQAFYSIFLARRDQVEVFKQAFHLFWRIPSQLPAIMDLMLAGMKSPENVQPKQSLRVQQALAENEVGHGMVPGRRNKKKEAVDLVLTYSPTEVLHKKDFAAFSAEEILLAKKLLEKMHWAIDGKRTKRFHADDRGSLFDLRRTIRKNLCRRGELLELGWRRQGTKPRDLIILCDISGSMERYARMLLHFMHSISGAKRIVETFVFGTRLTRITRTLRLRDIDDAITSVSQLVNDWCGGTRIGESIRIFNYVWARRVLRSGAVVLIISDGWDRGDIPLLAREMARLSRSCSRLIWLNPNLGYQQYAPLTQGIQAALPFVDDFLPVHNLVSLQQLGDLLASIGKTPIARGNLSRHLSAGGAPRSSFS